MATAKLSYNEDEKAILAHFTNGRIDKKCTRRIHFGYFEGDQNNKKLKDRKMLVAETTDMSYVGQNYGPLASTMQQNCKYYVGVLDKTTGKMKICDAEIFQMHPKPSDIDDEVETFSLPSTVTEKTFVEKNDMLTSAFGSKKKQRALESRLKNQIKGKALDKAMSSVLSQASSIEPVQFVHPNEKQATAEASGVFFDATLDTIQQWRKENKYPKQILSLLSRMPKTEERRSEQATYIMYLYYLIHLHNLKQKQLRDKDPLPTDWPDHVRFHLLKRFTQTISGTSKQRIMPARLKDKLVCHILVLCLFLEEFSLELTNLQTDLSKSHEILYKHCQILGCSTKVKKVTTEEGSTSVRWATLSLPLQLPTQERRKRKH
uniref:DNA-directed RNA polymerase I subunit RPA49 n=1 Tax=Magallana gigas TaxID=29159 RepID=K1PI91_MAGGI